MMTLYEYRYTNEYRYTKSMKSSWKPVDGLQLLAAMHRMIIPVFCLGNWSLAGFDSCRCGLHSLCVSARLQGECTIAQIAPSIEKYFRNIENPYALVCCVYALCMLCTPLHVLWPRLCSRFRRATTVEPGHAVHFIFPQFLCVSRCLTTMSWQAGRIQKEGRLLPRPICFVQVALGLSLLLLLCMQILQSPERCCCYVAGSDSFYREHLRQVPVLPQDTCSKSSGMVRLLGASWNKWV